MSFVRREAKWLREGYGLLLRCATHLLSFGSSLPGRVEQCFPFLPSALRQPSPGGLLPSGKGWNGVTVPFLNT